MHWIPCNLPWAHTSLTTPLPPIPLIPEERTYEHFGTTVEQLEEEMRRVRRIDPKDETLAPMEAKRREILAWEKDQPEGVAYRERCREVLEEVAKHETRARDTTFCGRELNFPGVLVEFADGSRVLLGHTDSEGKMGNTAHIFPQDIVVQYMVLDMPGHTQVSQELREQLIFRAANDFRTLPDRGPEACGPAACLRLGFRASSLVPAEAEAAREALQIYTNAYHQVQRP